MKSSIEAPDLPGSKYLLTVKNLPYAGKDEPQTKLSLAGAKLPYPEFCAGLGPRLVGELGVPVPLPGTLEQP